MTGHLVLTTLHTNDAVAALTRLVDMGIEPFLIASSLSLVVAQRLVRRPCADCAAPYMPSARVLDVARLSEADLVDATPMRGRGCGECGGTGYRGRTGIFEVLPVTASVRVRLGTHANRSRRWRSRPRGRHDHAARELDSLVRDAARRPSKKCFAFPKSTRPDGSPVQSCDRAVDDDMIACPWCATVVDRGHCGSSVRGHLSRLEDLPVVPHSRSCRRAGAAALRPIAPRARRRRQRASTQH